MKNNLENKAKFFALYWMQKVFKTGKSQEIPHKNSFGSSIKHTDFLSLKSLASMTDEDALEIVHFMGWKSVDEPRLAKTIILTLLVIKSNDPIKEDIFIKQMLYNLTDVSATVDFIRSLGYAFRWQDVSVEQQVEFGWIVLD